MCRMYSMCIHVTLLFSSVYSWRCVFYLFAFVYGVLALYDVSSIVLVPFFWFMVCPSCQSGGFSGPPLLSICLVSPLWFHCVQHVKLRVSPSISCLLVIQGFHTFSQVTWQTDVHELVAKTVTFFTLYSPTSPLLCLFLTVETLVL